MEAYIILCPTGQDSDGSTYFVVSSNDGVDISLAGLFRQVDSVLGKSFVLFFGILGIDPLCSGSLLYSRLECLGCDSCFFQGLLQDWVLDKRSNDMILCDIRILLSLLDCLRRSQEFERGRT